jgi:hypothetical protein
MKDLLIQSQRVTGTRKSITVIDPERINEFFERLEATDIDLQLKTIIAVSLSGGLRVSECLSLTPDSIKENVARVRVLKKTKKDKKGNPRNPVYRQFHLHAVASRLLNKWSEVRREQKGGLRNFTKYFTVGRNNVYKQIVKILGPGTSPHSIARHSHMSYLLHVKGLSQMKVARLLEVWPLDIGEPTTPAEGPESAESFPEEHNEKHRISCVEAGRAVGFKTEKEANEFFEEYNRITEEIVELDMEKLALCKKHNKVF